MYTTTVKRALLLLTIFVVVLLACDMLVTIASPTSPAPLPTNTTFPVTEAPTLIPASPTKIPATLVPAATSTALQSSFEGVEVSVDPLSIVLSPALASGVRGTEFPRTDGQDLPDWELTPGHRVLKLEGYRLQGKLHEPQIYVYPALEYAEILPAAFESIHRLDNILYPPGGPDLNNPLPTVPFFNAAQVFASNVQLISFQNGQGARFVTEYAQYAVPANNYDLFYHFQGVTRDGAYYIVAILPISNPMLAETNDARAPLPTGGVPYPYLGDPNADMQNYYKSVLDVLNATPAEAFTPTLNELDLLIQSMRVSE